MKFLIRFTLLFLVIGLSGCDVINPEEDIPAYIEVLPFEYTASIDGSNSTKITDAWVTVNGNFLGAFNLPVKLPVLEQTGSYEVLIDAGIKDNALNTFPNIYPFYERYTQTVDLEIGEVVSVQPDTRYDMDITQMVFQENFDDGTINVTDVDKTVVDVLEGSGSGLIELDNENLPSLTVGSIPLTTFPSIGNTAYIELDYKNDVPLLIGMAGIDATGLETFSAFPFGVIARDTWNKAYFNFTDVMRTLEQNNTAFYQIRILAQIPLENGEFVLENAEIRLDNLKLLMF